MIKSAKDNGADAVKFQLWDPNNLAPGSWDKDGRRGYNKAYINEKNLIVYNFSKIYP